MIPNIIDYNLKKDYQFLIIFGTNIPDTTGHQMTIQVPTSPTSASALPAKNGTSETYVEINKKNFNFISDLWPLTAQTWVRSITTVPVSCSSESIRRRLGMSMNSRSDWLGHDWSGTEHCQRCYQRMEKASACLCSHKGPIFWKFTDNWTIRQTAVSQSDRNLDKMCFTCFILVKQLYCLE